jgi:hypothetical protein
MQQETKMDLHKTGIQRGLMAAATLAAFMTLGAHPGFARGAGGGMGAGAGAMGSQAGGSANGNFGGQSGGHVNAQGTLNTNGPNATDRDFGRDRAEDRANGNANVSSSTHVRTRGRFLSTSTNAGGSVSTNAHRWRHGRHHHFGWRVR